MKRLADEIAKATSGADAIERFRNDGTIAIGSTPAEFAAFIHKEQARWGEVVRRSGVKAE